jgi:hypothetical protein
MIGGTAVAVAFGYPLYWEAIFIGAILTATSVSISAQDADRAWCAPIAGGRDHPRRSGD